MHIIESSPSTAGDHRPMSPTTSGVANARQRLPEASAGLSLTAKGLRYCHEFKAPGDYRAWRQSIEAEVERLIGILDAFDGDTDLEADYAVYLADDDVRTFGADEEDQFGSSFAVQDGKIIADRESSDCGRYMWSGAGSDDNGIGDDGGAQEQYGTTAWCDGGGTSLSNQWQPAGRAERPALRFVTRTVTPRDFEGNRIPVSH